MSEFDQTTKDILKRLLQQLPRLSAKLQLAIAHLRHHFLRIALIVFVVVGLYFLSDIVSIVGLKLISSKYQHKEKPSEKQLMNIENQLVKFEKLQEENIPKNPYLVINTTANEFALYRKNELIKKDKCSTGSYVLLRKGNKQEWIFKTPKGEFKVLAKTKDPVWKKPDWAFVEEGLPVPSANHPSRFEYGVLGDYSLSLGDGYLIHGTLYQRFLGLPVTHGCVRLNDENLELVYKNLPVGAKVFIF